MTVKRAAPSNAKKGKADPCKDTGYECDAAPNQERRFIDVDPWAVLLEQLMEVPEESAPAERKRGKGK